MRLRSARRFAAVSALALALAAPAAAEIHRWVDESGNVHFSDQAPGGTVESTTLESDAARHFEHQVSSALIFELDAPPGWRSVVKEPLELAIPIQLDPGDPKHFFAISVERGSRNAVTRLIRRGEQQAAEIIRARYAGSNLAPDTALRGFRGERTGGIYFPGAFEGEIEGVPFWGGRVAALFGFGEVKGGLHFTFVVVTQPHDPAFEDQALEVVRSASARLAPAAALWEEASDGPADALVRKMRALALTGDPLAPVFLGDFALEGAGGMEKDADEARRWYQLAADRGAPEGFYGLAILHRNGRGVPKNPGLAAEHYARAAEGGHADSALQLAYMHQVGNGVARDDAWALRWADKAANRGSAQALLLLGQLHEYGHGTEANPKTALGYYVLGARAGVREAQAPAERLKRRLQAEAATDAPPPAAREASQAD